MHCGIASNLKDSYNASLEFGQWTMQHFFTFKLDL